VVSGRGNNGEDGTEGVVKGNAVGSYLHGCLLSKNPWLADWLLKKALERKYGNYQLGDLDDNWEMMAHDNAAKIAGKYTNVTNISSKK
jgi:CobQ-like glutamine amidotransferase family enzyme